MAGSLAVARVGAFTPSPNHRFLFSTYQGPERARGARGA